MPRGKGLYQCMEGCPGALPPSPPVLLVRGRSLASSGPGSPRLRAVLWGDRTRRKVAFPSWRSRCIDLGLRTRNLQLGPGLNANQVFRQHVWDKPSGVTSKSLLSGGCLRTESHAVCQTQVGAAEPVAEVVRSPVSMHASAAEGCRKSRGATRAKPEPAFLRGTSRRSETYTGGLSPPVGFRSLV